MFEICFLLPECCPWKRFQGKNFKCKNLRRVRKIPGVKQNTWYLVFLQLWHEKQELSVWGQTVHVQEGTIMWKNEDTQWKNVFSRHMGHSSSCSPHAVSCHPLILPLLQESSPCPRIFSEVFLFFISNILCPGNQPSVLRTGSNYVYFPLSLCPSRLPVAVALIWSSELLHWIYQ